MLRIKKIAIVLICIAVLTAVCGCGKSGNNAGSEAGQAETPESNPVSSEADEVKPYSSIACRTLTDKELHLINVKIPKYRISAELQTARDWDITDDGSSCLGIIRSGRKIGKICLKSDSGIVHKFDTDKWTNISLNTEYTISCDSSDGTGNFYHVFKFLYKGNASNPLYMYIDYAELSRGNAVDMMSNARALVCNDSTSLNLNDKNGSNEIGIWGNSFIGSSQVGEILTEFLKAGNKQYTVDPVCVGMANINTFNEEYYLSRLRSGQYFILFQCGFYSYDATSANALANIKAACKSSGTKLVIFPAHNESRTSAAEAASANSDIYLLNWKNEIDNLIQSGVPADYMYVNDYHKHSTPNAGYVGAQMIYRMLFKAMPPAIDSGPVWTEAAGMALGNEYVSTGKCETGSETQAYTLK